MGKQITMANTPIVVQKGSLSSAELEAKATQYDISEIVDIFALQLDELATIKFQGNPEEVWVYMPWSKVLLHTVGSESLFALRTNRNKLLVTEQEQQLLRKAVVGIAGMSVGSGMALGMVYSGIADTIKIADRDVLDTSNLNRLREPLSSVGKPKAALAAQHIYDLNPYATVHQFDEGVTAENIDDFFTNPGLSVAIDEIDDFKMKVQLRLKAKEYKTPLLMLTSLGDNILVDVERYDLDADLQPFHGLIGDTVDDIVNADNLTPEDIRKYSVALVGPEYIPTRALQSVLEMGKSLAGRPQLYSTIAIDGGLAAYVVRRIILSDGPRSGRYFVKLHELLNLRDTNFADSAERRDVLTKLGG